MSSAAIGTLGCLAGIAITMTLGILTSPALHALRKNPFIFCCVAIGAISCAAASIYSLHVFVVPQAFVLAPFPGIFVIYAYCLYAVMIERTVPLLQKSISFSPTKRQLIRYGLPLLLDIPQIVIFGAEVQIDNLIAQGQPFPPYLMDIAIVAGNMGSFFMLACEMALSVLFIRTLTKYRKSSLITFIIENKGEALVTLIALIVPLVFFVVKLATISTAGFPTTVFDMVFNFGYSLVSLVSFSTYLYVTTKVPREIFQTKFEGLSKEKSSKSETTATKQVA
ncbi:hypothetical protein BKA69DRAFT_1129565 [Paraphysoderma sedebokerense]|nr:hypothetical protein BKA69DRAFT_1129565 [Paraphysoderma sedebokerense]